MNVRLTVRAYVRVYVYLGSLHIQFKSLHHIVCESLGTDLFIFVRTQMSHLHEHHTVVLTSENVTFIFYFFSLSIPKQ